MEDFTLKGENGFIKIEFVEVFGFPEKTSPLGGYDVEGKIQIIADELTVNGTLWFTTANLYQFYESLNQSYEKLEGNASFNASESDLTFNVLFNNSSVSILGKYVSPSERNNSLNFEISSDQSYLRESLSSLNSIVNKYGTERGVK